MDEKVLKLLALGLDSKNPEAIKAYNNLLKVAQGKGEEAEKARTIINKVNSYRTKKAVHGAKLNYFKSLKNQCPEGEELVYYKKGGSVTCGCKKKEQGGEVPTAKCGSAVEKFKARKAQKGDTLARIADATGSLGGFKNAQKAKEASKKEDKKKDFENKWKKNQVVVGKDLKKGNNNVTKKEREDVTKDKCGSKIKKHQEGSVITKFKMHRNGGSLNRIPFYLGGTSKEGVLRSIYKNPQIDYYELSAGTNPMWYRFAYPNQNYILSDNDLGKPGEGVVFISDERVPGSYLGGTNGGWDPTKRKRRFNTPKTFIGSLYNTWEAFADSIRNANGFKPAQNRKVKVKK